MSEYDSHRYALINRWDPDHLKNIDRLLPLTSERVLEVGCGQGHLTKRLAARGIDVTGIDANPRASEIAETDRVIFMRGESLEFDDESFDVVLSVHAIEHIPEIEMAITEMGRVLKAGGRALHIYPAEPIMGLYAIPTSIILYGTPFKARQVHCHKLWPSKLRRLMEPSGLVETHSEFRPLKTPQFISVFEKRA